MVYMLKQLYFWFSLTSRRYNACLTEQNNSVEFKIQNKHIFLVKVRELH